MTNEDFLTERIDFSRMKPNEFELHGALSLYGRGVFRYVEHASLPEGLFNLSRDPDAAAPFQKMHIESQRKIEHLLGEYERTPENDRVLSNYPFNYDMVNNTLHAAELMLQVAVPGFKTTVDRRMEIDPEFKKRRFHDSYMSDNDVI